jgi:OOP family OmpA-OmpF porin
MGIKKTSLNLLKMTKLAFIFLGLIAQLSVLAQPQWACKIASTNDPNTDNFAPSEVLFVPDAYPSGKTDDVYTYCFGFTYEKNSPTSIPTIKIKLEYCNPIIAEQVLIVETYKPGSITKVEIEDVNGKVRLIHKAKPVLDLGDGARLFYIPFTRSSAPIKYVSIEATPGDVPGVNCIDAVALLPSKDPINIKINLGADISFIEPAKVLGSGVNTTYTEVFPVISPDGQTLFFDRKDDPNNISNPSDPTKKHDDIYKSVKQSNGDWSTAINVGGPLNNWSHNFVNSISPDGNTMLLANTYNADGSPKGAGASITKRIKGSGWSIPQEIKIEGFTNRNDYVSFFMGNSNDVLFMSIENDESYGEKDIFVSFPKADGSWSKPLNIGATINTMQTEYSPVLASDNSTLYFASQGHYGYGGDDIFMSKRLDNTWTNWSNPVNLGPNVNTMEDDYAFSIPASGKEVYFYSYNGKENKSDIYHLNLGQSQSIKPAPVYLISGVVYNAKTKKPMHADIVYETLSNGTQAGKASSDPDNGKYKIVLPAGDHYGYFAKADGFIAVHENLDVPDITVYTEIHKDLYLVPIEIGQTVSMQNVFFQQSTATLLGTSSPELDRLVVVLQTNPTVEIRIDGHTDNVGDAKKDMVLSQQRADAIKTYFISKGISAKRITTKAFGGTKPIASNATEATRKLNRRVEFTILKQ